MLIKIIAVVLSLLVLLAGGSVTRNNVPILESPGPGKRLLIYLTRNTAATEPGHVLPELRTRTYDLSPDELFERVRSVAASKGWEVAGEDTAGHRLHLVVTTPWLRFKDDLHVELEAAAGSGSRLNVSSGSRVGRADYGANISHIIELHQALDAAS